MGISLIVDKLTVYRINKKGDTALNNWGWVKMSDLVHAANQLRFDQVVHESRKRWTPASILEAFGRLDVTHTYWHFTENDDAPRGFPLIPEKLNDPTLFVPAGWGLDVLKIIRAGGIELAWMANERMVLTADKQVLSVKEIIKAA